MRRALAVLLLLLCVPALALDNALRNHPSPYLGMHADDPIAWQSWGQAALELARRDGKLLFISSGYFACHWCHVMQRETFRNAATAERVNRDFIPVKLDRELHEALDAYLIDFVERTQGVAGWPLNVFLTPDGYPLIGMTYVPTERFDRVIERLALAWGEERGRLRELARRLHEQSRVSEAATTGSADVPALKNAFIGQTLALADRLGGGFGEQSRFPMAPQLRVLLELSAPGHPDLEEFLRLTLDRMASEGLRDHVGGGFFRYTVDPTWHVPHFEKMLYTQALLAEIYLIAAERFKREDYALLARQTLDFVLREMQRSDGGFVSSLSALDAADREGGAYLWRIESLHTLLGEDDTALARRHWRMFDVPPFDAGHLPMAGQSAAEIAEALDLPVAQVETRLDGIRQRLLEDRRRRGIPMDDKVLAGWNGLMLSALSRAAQRYPEAPYREAAARLQRHLRERLWDGERLLRAESGGFALGRASLEDYAYVAAGMTQYAQLTGRPQDATFAVLLLHLAWQRFHGEPGWLSDDAPLIPGMGRVPALPDGALPSPSAVLIATTLGYSNARLIERASQAADAARASILNEPFVNATSLAALLGLEAAAVTGSR